MRLMKFLCCYQSSLTFYPARKQNIHQNLFLECFWKTFIWLSNKLTFNLLLAIGALATRPHNKDNNISDDKIVKKTTAHEWQSNGCVLNSIHFAFKNTLIYLFWANHVMNPVIGSWCMFSSLIYIYFLDVSLFLPLHSKPIKKTLW